MGQQTNTLKTPDGASLFTRAWMPEGLARGAILLVHGYGEHSGRYEHVADYFVKQGYMCFAMDSRGHGQSATAQSDVRMGYFPSFEQLGNDLALFVKVVDAQRPAGRPLFMIGHSMGGLLTLYYLVYHRPPPTMIRGAVTSGALLDVDTRAGAMTSSMVKSVLSPFLPKLGTMAVDPQLVSRDPAVVKAYQDDPLVYHGKIPARVAAEWIDACQFVKTSLKRISLPILVMHGGADQIVSPDCATIIHEGVSSPDKSIKIYEGLYHEIFNEQEQARVLADVWVWLAAHSGTGELKPRHP